MEKNPLGGWLDPPPLGNRTVNPIPHRLRWITTDHGKILCYLHMGKQ